MLKKLLIASLLYMACIANASALSFSKKTELVSLKVTPEYKTLSPELDSIALIAEADIKSGWHLYWDNPGDIGAPTMLSFYDSPHYAEISSEHSAPEKSVFEDIITSYVYTKKIYFKTTFSLNGLTPSIRLPFNLTLSYTACSESCLPEEIPLRFALPVAANAEKNPTYLNAALIAENTFPSPLNATASLKDELLELKIEEQILKDCQEPEFVSRHPKKGALSELPETKIAEKGSLHVDFHREELPPDFKGVLLCPGHAYYLEPETPNAPASAAAHHQPAETAPASAPEEATGLFYYLLTAFLAGLILNLMPCVLPILSLKALYLVQNSKHASPLSALAYLAGVVSSFILLAAVLFYLREKGTELGWGFQLQSPAFNALLLLLFVLIFLNLADKLPLPDRYADKLSKIAGNKSFLTGFFAVVIACPCTGPFMGAALGYAIAKPAPVYFGIFLALSLGYALPYTLIELFPRFFLKYIPKPGRWMLTFKKILALPILLTCFWLAWVIFNQLRPSAAPSEIAWEAYAPAKVQQAQAAKQPVFINFTAKWCLVCLLNDKTSLSTESFKNLAAKENIRLLKADWTNRDEDIRDALKSYGRNSIPLYVYYAAGSKTPVILPQILTPEILKEQLK